MNSRTLFKKSWPKPFRFPAFALFLFCSQVHSAVTNQVPATTSPSSSASAHHSSDVAVSDRPSSRPVVPANFFVTDLEDRPYTSFHSATNSPESRPCETDSDGHWGEDVFGFRIGLRLAKRSFTNGEPVEAIVLLRNVSGKTRHFPVPHGEPTGFQAIFNGKREMRSEPGGGRPINAKQWEMWAQSQKRFVIRVDRRLDMSQPGKYIVWAQMETKYPSSGPPWAVAQIFSAPVEIEVRNGNPGGE